jgi:hypothetical protein
MRNSPSAPLTPSCPCATPRSVTSFKLACIPVGRLLHGLLHSAQQLSSLILRLACAQIPSLAARLSKRCAFERVFAVSALRNYGTPALFTHLSQRALPGAWELAHGQPSELTWPELAAELVREKVFWAHNQEVPYQASPRCLSFDEGLDGRLKVHVVRCSPL